MDIKIEIKDILDAVTAKFPGVPRDWLVLALAALVLLKWLGILNLITGLFAKAIKSAGRMMYNPETRMFVGLRNRFVEHLIYDVERLNRESVLPGTK